MQENQRKKTILFMRILLGMGMSEEETLGICSFLTKEAEMDELVEFIKANPTATPEEITEEVARIALRKPED